MSDPVVKPEESIVAVGTPSTSEPATTTTPAVEVTEDAASKTDDATEDKKDEEAVKEKPEPKEITHGTLSKTHGGLLSFFKLKRFFYFQDEAITEDNLKTYLHKDNSSKATAAYASQTGKGLWFYAKDEGRKEAPHGIIKLADVTEVTESGSNKFVLKLSTGDLHFEAPAAERDSWVFTLKAKISEAKATAEEIVETEGYKAVLERLTKPVSAVKPAAKVEEAKDKEVDEVKAGEEAKTEATPAAAVTSDEEAAPAEAKPDVKRSTSKKNKRISGFAASSFFGKKEKSEDKKPEEKKEEEKKDEEAKEDKPVDATEVPAVPAPGVTEPVVAAEPAVESKPEDVKPATEEARPEPTKKANRQSFFARFGKRDESTEEKKDKEPEAAKDAPTVAEPEAHVDTTVAVDTTSPAAEKAMPASPKSDLLSFFGKRDKSPAPKAAEEKPEAKPEIAAVAPTVEVTTEPAAAPAAAPAEENPVVEAATSPKEKRKSSFFGFGKEKKPEEVKSDSEDTEPAATKPATSPVPKSFLGGLKRKVSKANKSADKPEAKEVATPAPVAEEEAPAPETAEPVKTETKQEEEATEASPAIGNVVPEAVTAGQNKPVQAAA